MLLIVQVMRYNCFRKTDYLVEKPFDPRHYHGEALLVLEQGDGLLALLHDVHLDVVLEILADSGQMAN